jgi:hypothetical protein
MIMIETLQQRRMRLVRESSYSWLHARGSSSGRIGARFASKLLILVETGPCDGHDRSWAMQATSGTTRERTCLASRIHGKMI